MFADAGALDERQQIGDFVLAPLRRPVAERDRVFADQSDRQIGGNHFPGRVRGSSSRFSQASWTVPEDEGVAAVVALVPGRIAIAAHVDQKHIEQRPVSDPAIDPAGLPGNLADRHEFMKRAARALNQPRFAVLGVTGLVGGADRRPVIGHLMIVPLRQHRHLCVEGAQILVEQIVFVVAAKLREAVGDGGFLFGDDIAPDFPVRQLQFGRNRTIGIDVIAAMNEEIRTVLQHGPVGAHAAAGGIDAPALPRGIARPDKRYRAFVAPARCGNARSGFRR